MEAETRAGRDADHVKKGVGVDQLKAEWRRIQSNISALTKVEDHLDGPVRLVGGTDVSFDKNDNRVAVATLVVCSFPGMEQVWNESIRVETDLPYVPTFLAFREAPSVLELLDRARRAGQCPDLLLLDGNGLLHPRACGLACYVGVRADIPTIGCAKNLYELDGLDERDVRRRAARELSGSSRYLYLDGASGRRWGCAVRSTDDSKRPIYVSVGHRVSLDTAVQLVLRCCHFRVPEPIRRADLRSRQLVADGELTRIGASPRPAAS